MITNRFYSATSVFLVVVLGYLTYQILQPFLRALAWAVVFAIVLYPVYAFLLRYLRLKTLASALTLLLLVVVIIGPCTYLSFVLVDEIGTLAQGIDENTFDSVIKFFAHLRITHLIDKIQSHLGLEGIGSTKAIMENLRSLGQRVAAALTAGIGNLAGMVVDFVFMLFALFFFLKDAPGLLSKFKDYLPFSEDDNNRLMSRVQDMIVSTVYGGILIAVLQGILGGIGFFLLGIGSPVLWGSAMIVMSFLPLLGTFAVWGPVAGYLFIEGDYMRGGILLLYGTLVITMVDNVLRPIIISGRTKMPALAVFFSVLGGIKYFGLIGFIMGPLVLALFWAVFQMFRNTEGGENA